MMLLLPAAAQPVVADPLSRILARDWQEGLLNFVRHDVPHLLIIFLVAFLLWRIVVFFVTRMRSLAERQVANSQRAAQLRTMASILQATAYAVLGFIVLLQVLLAFGVHIEPLLASAGVVGVGIGLGAQSIFKDMLNGIFILVEDQYNVGETIRIAGLAGTVEKLTLRCTTLRDGDGSLYIVPNSQITTVANLSRDFAVASVIVAVDATADPDHVLSVLRSLAGEVRSDAAFRDIVLKDPDVPGIDAINGRQVNYPVLLRVRANQKDGVLRELRRRIIKTFEREGIPLGSESSLLVLQKGDPTATAPATTQLGA